MSENFFKQFINSIRNKTEQELKKESPETGEVLDELEQEKVNESSKLDDEENVGNPKDKKEKKLPRRSTADFVEKHGGIISRKEKKHTSKGVNLASPRKDKLHTINKHEQLQQELKDHDISHPGEWREAINLNSDEDNFYESGQPREKVELKNDEDNFYESGQPREKVELKNFEHLFDYLEGGLGAPDQLKIEKFKNTKDNIERLQLLSNMKLSEMAQCIRESGLTDSAFHYLSGRLEFYQKLIQGKAVKRYKSQEWNFQKGECIDVIMEEPIDQSVATPETIKLGLLRDTIFAGMIGSPEMAIFKISKRRCEERKILQTHFPLVKGYHSGIFEGNIGWAFPLLRKTYERARSVIEGRLKGQEISEQEIEHKAVMMASSWLTESMNYNPSGRGPESPYVSGHDEAIAWTRLGEQVKKQLRGMRQKIQSVDLHNIERFIGKSGVDKYDSERKRLYGQIKFLKEGNDQEKKQEFTTRENNFAIQKQERWLERENERLNNKLKKSKKEIEEAQLPEDEAVLQLKNVEDRHFEEMRDNHLEVQEKIAYFQNRTTEQLLADIEGRQKLVEVRHEKRKSLAQKALDLHFHFNHTGRRDGNSEEESQDKSYKGVVDWINYAPLGTIKRAHKMLRQGISDKTVMEVSIADIILGKNGIDRESMRSINNLSTEVKILEAELKNKQNISESFNDRDWNDPEKQKATNEYYEAYSKYNEKQNQIQNLIRTGSILSNRGYALSLEELIEFSKKNINGLYEALGEFNLDEIKYLINNNVNLVSATDMKKDIKGLVGDAMPVAVICKLVKHSGGKELIRNTIEAGFTVEEIVRFPFLVSPLITKK
jgi:hypothetical protein